MEKILDRFLRYVAVDTQSNEESESQPSTAKQLNLLRMLCAELNAMGVEATLDEFGYVMGSIPSNVEAKVPAIGFIAHVDTAPDASGADIKPQIVEHYDGGEIALAGVPGLALKPSEFPEMLHYVGQTLVTTDGTTLLGADDKAGVAEICALLQRLKDNPELPHPTIKAAFVPDEEIGHGASLLDLDKLGAAYGYTVDGDVLGSVSYECFSASEATVRIKGVMVHPGSAKDIMVNAITLAAEFLSMVPASERPEHTEGREGFYHPTDISGSASEVEFSFILRDFDSDVLARREQTLRDIAAFMNVRYGDGTVEVSCRQQYRNMAEQFAGKEFLIDYALEANEEVGLSAFTDPIRGGTDGAQLTFRGLPCPNLATGGYNYHSVREFVPVPSLEKSVDMLTALVAKFA